MLNYQRVFDGTCSQTMQSVSPSKNTVRNSINSVANITSFGKNRGAGVANRSLSIIYLLVVEYREPMGTFY